MTDNKQQEMKEEINANLAKKDYYDILRVPKTASDTDIKKAYRTLALKFHPDKNSAEGSKQVFKKVSHAYSVLIDAEKKQHYDQFGPEQDQPRPTNRRRHHQDDFEFNEYDDIFRAFFGGAAQQAQRGGNFRTYSYSFGGNQGNQRNQGQAQQQQRGGINFSLVFIILFLVYTLAPLFKSSPSYSSIPSSDHKFNMKTSLLHVDFYVSQSYFQESSNPQFKKQAEMIIDREYLVDLQKKCQGKKKEKKRLQETAYRESPGVRRENYLGQAKRVDLITCRTITDLNEQHEDYVRDLTYMK